MEINCTVNELFYALKYYNYYIKHQNNKRLKNTFYKRKNRIIHYLLAHYNDLDIEYNITHILRNKKRFYVPIEFKCRGEKLYLHTLLNEHFKSLKWAIPDTLPIVDKKMERKKFRMPNEYFERERLEIEKINNTEEIIKNFYSIIKSRRKRRYAYKIFLT